MWDKLTKQGEAHHGKKIDRERDAVEYSKTPDAFTFAPAIMGDHRAGKQMATYSEIKQQAGHQVPKHSPKK